MPAREKEHIPRNGTNSLHDAVCSRCHLPRHFSPRAPITGVPITRHHVTQDSRAYAQSRSCYHAERPPQNQPPLRFFGWTAALIFAQQQFLRSRDNMIWLESKFSLQLFERGGSSERFHTGKLPAGADVSLPSKA